MFCDVETYRPTAMRATLTQHLDTEIGAQRKIKILLHNNHYCLPREIYQNSTLDMGIPHLLVPEKR